MKWIERSLIKKSAFFLIFLVLSIKVFDIALSFIKFPTNEIPKTYRSLTLREFIPNLNKVIKPSDNYMLNVENLIQKDYLVRTDKDGFLVGPKDFIASKDRIDVIFFGGSTTECIYVDEEKRFPYLVSLNLNIRVLNGGKSGSHSLHSLLSMIGKGIVYKPKHIVLMNVANDLVSLSKTLSYWKGPEGRDIIQFEIEVAKKSILLEMLINVKNLLVPNLWKLIRPYFINFIETGRDDEWFEYRDVKFESADVEKILIEQFTASLRSFVKISRAWDIEPILMTQFNRIKKDDLFVRKAYEKNPQAVSYDDFVFLYKKANDIVRKVALEEKVFLIDLDAQIPSTKEYIYDAFHVNSKGSELVAEKITTALKKQYPDYYQ